MKKLLLHVGYPKSASTSLQNGLFLGLHEVGLINFLGRAFESDFYGQKQGKGEYKTWFDHILSHGSFDANSIGQLSANIPNVLSEGLFMMNERRTDSIAAPAVLQKYFAPHADKIEVLIVIRRQQDLIPSYYFQNYRRFEQKVFSDFLAHQTSSNWAGESKIFDFYRVAKAYAQALGKDNVHIVLFEDFVQNKTRFGAQLGSAMGVDPVAVEPLLGQEHLNKTPKEEGVVVVRKPQSKFRKRLARIAEKLKVGGPASSPIRLPGATDEEKAAIFNSFQDGNGRLADEFSLDKQAMREYRYF